VEVTNHKHFSKSKKNKQEDYFETWILNFTSFFKFIN